MTSNIGYDKYFFSQSDYIRYKGLKRDDKLPNHPNQCTYIQTIHNSSAAPRNELSAPCIFQDVSTNATATCIFKLTDCQLLYYTSKGVIAASPKSYSCASKSASIDVIYPCTLQLFTAQDLNNIYKTNLPLTSSYIRVVITRQSYDHITMPLTIDMLVYEMCKKSTY